MGSSTVADTPAAAAALAALRSSADNPIVQFFPHGAIIAFDRDLRYLSAGGEGLGAVGLSRELLEGRTIFEAFTPDVVAVLEPLYRRALAGEPSSTDVQFQGRTFLQRLGPLSDTDGRIVAGMGFSQDVTEAREYERRLRESETRLRAAFDNGPVPMAIIDLGGRIQQGNAALAAFLGESVDELTGRRIDELTHPDDLADNAGAVGELLAGSAGTPVDQRYCLARGGIAWGTKSMTLIRGDDGTPSHFVVQIQDITERKMHDEVLQAERRRLTEAEAIGGVGSWEMDVQSTAVTWSTGMFHVWGCDPEMFGGDYAAAMESVVAEDLPLVNASIASCATTGEPITFRFRVRRDRDGEIRWLNARAEASTVDGHITTVRGAVADITEHVQARLDAEATQAFQQAVFSATPDTIAVWDLEKMSIVWANRSITERLGYSAEEGNALSADLVANLVVPEDQERFTASLVKAMSAADGEVVEVDFRMRHRDGAPRWFSRRTVPLRRNASGRIIQIIGITRETTAERVVADALAESEAMFRQLADSVDVAFFLRSVEPSKFLYASPGFTRIFGYDPVAQQETPNAATSRVHPGDAARFHADYWTATSQGRAARIDYRVVRADGEIRWIRSTTAPVAQTKPGPQRMATTCEDITLRREAEAALVAASTAERANAAKNEFLSRMSHELRTPLNAVLGFAQLLELDNLTSSQHSGVQHILRGGRHLLGLIDDVLDISKIEGDHLELSLEMVPVSALLAETVDLMAPQARASGVTLHHASDPAAHSSVKADQRRLRQVLINLLSNAIKYNRRGGRVDVSCRVGVDGRVHIDVADTGQGIKDKDLPRLFTPFDRLGAESTGIEGTGVGLALSQRLMALMDGTLTATSEAGFGSTFTASIPLIGPQWAHPAAALAATPVESVPASGEPGARTLLYIEDNNSNVELMGQLIRRRPGWQLLVAGNGALGIELAATAAPELVLLDLHLPDGNGIDVLRSLLAAPATRALEVVVVSADANPHQQERLRSAGASDYLTKPLDVHKVLALLDRPTLMR